MTEEEKAGYKKWLKEVGAVVRSARKLRGQTQKEAAIQAGFKISFYRDIEYGRRPITTRTLYQLANRLGLPVPYTLEIILCD